MACPGGLAKVTKFAAGAVVVLAGCVVLFSLTRTDSTLKKR